MHEKRQREDRINPIPYAIIEKSLPFAGSR